jgi:cytosine/adenosine deaminase-related metal-dependent hydrolase
MADQRTLIKGGIVLTLDRELGDFERADVLVEGARIAAVGPDLEAPEGATVIDAGRAIVMPGFVDTHRHTWQAQLRTIACDWTLGQYMTGLHSGLSGHFRPEDTYIGNLLGTVEALDSGITMLLDWSHNLATPEHADAAIEGLRESGARAVFAHGGGAPQWDVLPNAVPHPEDARRVRAEHFPTDDGLVTMAMALRGPEIATKEVTVTDYELARDLGLRITVHVGNGEMAKDRPLAWLYDEGLMGDDVTYVHCNAVGDDELAMVASSGGTASCSPDIELQMGHGWPATGRLLRAGIRPTISIDVCSSNGGHMFGAMRSLIGVQRGFDHADARDRGQPLDHVPLTCREVVEFATIDGARACGLDDRIGTLTPGKQADIILLSTESYGMFPANNPYGAVVYNAHPGVVDTILVAGRVVKRGGELLGPDRERVRRLAFESRDHIFEQAQATAATVDATIGGAWMPHHF